ncbi:hypothetical protein pdam_00004326 [Pocillopora damicornis]|uniref:IMS import disulfide relay-system CHCH-CHCH-like Cx9C domain-containing protein n=1 Tax=Pocillopora damicornis TaxID=46731 RepID=A0A3M6T8D6_POCDA|nr:uncharacterized protein LOC113681102 [Pocillopora damicornis]RMX37667.1 hypothetical protein pdam_00004326 [Pocillopora damicornis]
MKISLVSCLLLFASVVFVKGRYLTEEDLSEGLEDELNELEPWQLEDPHMRHRPKPVKSLNGAVELLLGCFREEDGQMKEKCKRKFREALPNNHPDVERVVECAEQSFQECIGAPKGHKPMKCMQDFKDCMKNEADGSGM